MNAKPHILVHRGTPWQGAINCSTNIYAKLFLEAGHPVTYMQGMSYLEHRLLRRGEAYASFRRGPRRDRGAWVFTPGSLLPGRGLPGGVWRARAAYGCCRPSIRDLVRAGGHGDPEWIFTARQGSGALRKIFPRARLAFQVVDYYPAFCGPSVRHVENWDYAQADHVFTIGRRLTDYVVGELGVPAGKVTTLGQGVFLDAYRADLAEPAELAGLPRPRAIWVGVCAKGDAELFAAAAAALARLGGSLSLLGPGAPWVDALCRAQPAVKHFGPKPAAEVPAWLTHCDAGLMLYDRGQREVYRGQNPLKLYEYAAAGLGILSTPHDEFADLQPPVAVVEEPAAVAPALAALWREEREARRARAREFAARYDWRANLGRIVGVLQRVDDGAANRN